MVLPGLYDAVGRDYAWEDMHERSDHDLDVAGSAIRVSALHADAARLAARVLHARLAPRGGLRPGVFRAGAAGGGHGPGRLPAADRGPDRLGPRRRGQDDGQHLHAGPSAGAGPLPAQRLRAGAARGADPGADARRSRGAATEAGGDVRGAERRARRSDPGADGRVPRRPAAGQDRPGRRRLPRRRRPHPGDARRSRRPSGASGETQESKGYVGLAGDPAFADAVRRLVLGDAVAPGRVAAAAATGGTGALRQALDAGAAGDAGGDGLAARADLAEPRRAGRRRWGCAGRAFAITTPAPGGWTSRGR